MTGRIVKEPTYLISSLTFVGGFLFLLYLFNGSGLLFFVSCFLLGLGLYPRFYLRMVSQAVEFENKRAKYYITNGDSGDLLLHFQNASRLPAIGVCLLAHDSVIKMVGEGTTLEKKYEFPFSIQPRTSTQITLPYKTLSRGMGRVNTLTLRLMDPLKLWSVRIHYEYVRQEVVSFPKKQAVNGLDDVQLLKEGSHSRPYSLFEDRALPIGTRDYTQGDPLKNIHWKATARKGELQTKLVEKTVGLTWSLFVLIGANMSKQAIENLELQLSAMARLAEIALKNDIQFNLVLNTKPAGRSLILQTPFGSDRPHYFRTMERLSAIQANFLRINPKLAIREFSRGLRDTRVIMFAGAVSEVIDDPILSNWKKKGHHLYTIEESGRIQPLLKGGVSFAN